MIKKYFGTDGIRGAINSAKNINGDMFFKFGLQVEHISNLKKRKQISNNC